MMNRTVARWRPSQALLGATLVWAFWHQIGPVLRIHHWLGKNVLTALVGAASDAVSDFAHGYL